MAIPGSGDRLVSGLDHTLEPSRPVRRVEIINGIGGRRRWSMDDKARIVEETLVPGAVVSEIARRHGLSPQQLFGWRRVPDDRWWSAKLPTLHGSCRRWWSSRRRSRLASNASLDGSGRAGGATGIIEMEIGGVTVRVGRGAEAKTVAAVIHALKATP